MAQYVPAAKIHAHPSAANDNPAPAARPDDHHARLSDRDVAVLMWLPTDGSARGDAGRPMINALLRLRRLGLCSLHFAPPGHRGSWRATRQGLLLQRRLPVSLVAGE